MKADDTTKTDVTKWETREISEFRGNVGMKYVKSLNNSLVHQHTYLPVLNSL